MIVFVDLQIYCAGILLFPAIFLPNVATPQNNVLLSCQKPSFSQPGPQLDKLNCPAVLFASVVLINCLLYICKYQIIAEGDKIDNLIVIIWYHIDLYYCNAWCMNYFTHMWNIYEINRLNTYRLYKNIMRYLDKIPPEFLVLGKQWAIDRTNLFI